MNHKDQKNQSSKDQKDQKIYIDPSGQTDTMSDCFVKLLREQYAKTDSQDIPQNEYKIMNQDFSALHDFYSKLYWDHRSDPEVDHEKMMEEVIANAKVWYMKLDYPFNDQIEVYLKQLIKNQQDQQNESTKEKAQSINQLYHRHQEFLAQNEYDYQYNCQFICQYFDLVSDILEADPPQTLPLFFLLEYFLTTMMPNRESVENVLMIYEMTFIVSWYERWLDCYDPFGLVNDDEESSELSESLSPSRIVELIFGPGARGEEFFAGQDEENESFDPISLIEKRIDSLDDDEDDENDEDEDKPKDESRSTCSDGSDSSDYPSYSSWSTCSRCHRSDDESDCSDCLEGLENMGNMEDSENTEQESETQSEREKRLEQDFLQKLGELGELKDIDLLAQDVGELQELGEME